MISKEKLVVRKPRKELNVCFDISKQRMVSHRAIVFLRMWSIP